MSPSLEILLPLLFLVGVATLFWLIVSAARRKREALRRTPQLVRSPRNPIITPRRENRWESEATFNPAALILDGNVHLLYRAIGSSGVSAVGYARSSDGVTINERLDHPAYYPRLPFEGTHTYGPGYRYREDPWTSGGGWGGCEDPKVTAIGDTIYMTYVANNGWEPQRIAITSINTSDFRAKRWRWRFPKFISRPGEINKSSVMLPEKLNGKFVFFHRVFPNILIDYVDDLEELGRGRWLEAKAEIRIRPGFWDSRKVSVGATPMKTPLGWLVIYHGVGEADPCRYKIGAMILKEDDPATVLYRSENPILEPDAPYENYWKPGVVYPSGAALIRGMLHVYYGGGDKVVCVATTRLETLLNHLVHAAPVPSFRAGG